MGEDAEGEAGCRLAFGVSARRCHCTIPESTDVCLRVVFGGGGGGVLLGSGGGRCCKTENKAAGARLMLLLERSGPRREGEA